MFAERYLHRNHVSGTIEPVPHPDVGITVVIPCYREPEILQTLLSIYKCRLPERRTEVIVLINHSEDSSDEVKAENLQTLVELREWISTHPTKGLQFFAVGPVALKKKWAGAGLARKQGMDEAVYRFNLLNRPEGIIVSLDADTLVEENYLLEIEQYFKSHPSHIGVTIRFKHQTGGLSAKHLEGILLYEKYMDYYKKALGFTGYPYPMYTVGSAFAVTAGGYVKRGGMNRRQAGEEFYFLQNLVQMGIVGEITSTTVYPSARLSDRVPFGTGPILTKWMRGQTDLTQAYHLDAFLDLKLFFDNLHRLFGASKQQYASLVAGLPKPVAAFLMEDDFWNVLNDLNQNCASLTSFRNRFYQKFNAFKILKFLNFSHGKYYQKADLAGQNFLLNKITKNKSNDLL